MTNRLDLIDPAHLRSGRIDHVIEVAKATSADLLEVLEHELVTDPMVSPNAVMALLTERSSWSLADIGALLRSARRRAWRAGRQHCVIADFEFAIDSINSVEHIRSQRAKIGFV